MALNFGPPIIDFSPLGKLGETYDAGVKRNREAAMNDARQTALAGFGQNGDLAALGQTLLRAGDLEGGMSALRLDAANKGTPWQKERAAAEDQRAADAAAEAKREHQRAEEQRQRAEERADEPSRTTKKNEFGDEVGGWRDPRTGTVTWDDGTTSQTPVGRREHRSDIPDPNAAVASARLDPEVTGSVGGAPSGTGSKDPGFVIPGTLQGFGPDAVRPPLASLAPPAAAGGTAVAAAPQAAVPAPLAPPAATGGVAVAQAPAAAGAVGGPVAAPPPPPVTQTQISQGTSNIPPMTPAEMVAEARRLGISPAQYRASRAAAIQKEMMAKSGGPDPEKALGEQAGKIAVGEQYIANAAAMRDEIKKGDVTGLWDRTMAVNGIGRQGEIQRQMESGVDALVHMMTGAGMAESEARRKVGRYEPTLIDTPASLLSKHDQLVSELTHWRELAYRGKGAPGPLPTAQPKFGSGGVLKFDANGNLVQ